MSLVMDCLVLFNPPPSLLQEQTGVSLLCSGEFTALTDTLSKFILGLRSQPSCLRGPVLEVSIPTEGMQPIPSRSP